MKEVFTMIVFLFIGFVMICVCGVGCWGWNLGMGIVNRQVNPDMIVQSYEWYEQQVRDIRAIEGQITDAKEAVETFKSGSGPAEHWTFTQREEFGRLNSNITGLKQAKRKMIEDYNARASMISRNYWKSSTLPQHIEE